MALLPRKDDMAERLLARQTRMEQQRSNFDAIWQDIAERIIPRKAKFTKKQTPDKQKGERLTDKIFDAVPALALDRFAAAVHSLVVPRNQVWHKLRPSDKDLAKNVEVQRYFEALNDRLFAARYAANFDNQVHEAFYDLGGFATMVMYVGDTGSKIQYRAVPLYQCWLAENQFGVVDVVHRRYMLTARNAVREFGEDTLPAVIVQCAKDSPEREFEFLSVCEPRTDMDVNRRDFGGMPFAQYDVCFEGRCVVKEEGYPTFPYATSRYSATPGDIYGRGPAELVLPDVKMLNEMNKTTMQGAQLRVLPPILAHRDGMLEGVRMTPAAVNYGGIDAQGRRLIDALEVGDPAIGLEMMDQKRKVIQDAFWNTLFQVLIDNPQMTATEAMLRAQEKGALLAPTASRIESEFLANIVDTELHILGANGLLPEAPEELIHAGGGYTIEYESPMAQARKAERGIAILRTWEQVAPLAQVIGPAAYRRFNPDKSVQILADANGYPAEAIYDDEEMAAIADGQQQQADMAALLQAAPVAASAAKDLASAQEIAARVPNTAIPAQ